jgi:hypothetical protein
MDVKKDCSQVNLVDRLCKFTNGRHFFFRKESRQVANDVRFFQASASVLLYSFLEYREVRATVSVSFSTPYTSRDFYASQKNIVDSLRSEFFNSVLEYLEKSCKTGFPSKYDSGSFKFCIQIHRAGVNKSSASYGYGFDECTKIEKTMGPFLSEDFEKTLWQRLEQEFSVVELEVGSAAIGHRD